MLGLAALLTSLSACSASDGSLSLMAIAPAAPDVEPGTTLQFTAHFAGTPETAEWSVVETGGGTIDAAGVYTAPEEEGTYTVAAKLQAVAAAQTTPVRVKRNVRVEVTPTSATLAAGESLTLTASVSGSVKTATWTVAEGAAGGTVTADGVYTAPETAGTYRVVATSTADASKSGFATVTVTAPEPAPAPPTVAVVVAPQSATLVGGTTLQLGARVTGSSEVGVTWSVSESGGGTVSAAGLYTAPTTAGTYHVVATSRADGSKTDTATLTVTAPAPAPAPTVPPPPPGVVPAFAGAQGGGSLARGGREGVVHEVTNLNDSGAGSLRACVEASGARTCVFRVAGTITLYSPMNVYNPYLTVAGQTAPAGGIQLVGKSITAADNMVNIRTHDVIWRYTKLRKGYTGTVQYAGAIDVYPGAYNVILDHNSIAWVASNSAGAWANWEPGARAITWSWNILAEPLASHSTGFLTGANGRSIADGMTDLDLHHNLFQSSNHRNPLLKNKSSRFVNNIVYNYCFYATQIGGGVAADIVGNYYKPGPRLASDPGCTGYAGKHEIEVYPGGNNTTPNGSPSLYVAGNKGPYLPDPAADNWAAVYEVTSENGAETGRLSTQYRRSAPLPASGVPITPEPVTSLEGNMMPTVGASQRLGCDGRWVANRDSLDLRLVGDYYAMRGTLPASETEVGGFPTIATGAPCADADRDGMPDAWESARGLDPNDPADGRRLTPSGYTNLEVYLNGA